ncbi:MAG: hypothetical protein ACRD1H_01080, partial [Vicinamibacterales bacterium]
MPPPVGPLLGVIATQWPPDPTYGPGTATEGSPAWPLVPAADHFGHWVADTPSGGPSAGRALRDREESRAREPRGDDDEAGNHHASRQEECQVHQLGKMLSRRVALMNHCDHAIAATKRPAPVTIPVKIAKPNRRSHRSSSCYDDGPMPSDKIVVRGAREHNLRNVDVEMP